MRGLCLSCRVHVAGALFRTSTPVGICVNGIPSGAITSTLCRWADTEGVEHGRCPDGICSAERVPYSVRCSCSACESRRADLSRALDAAFGTAGGGR